MKLKLETIDGIVFDKEYDLPVTVEHAVREVQEALPYTILLCRIDGVTYSLNKAVGEDCTIQLLDMRDRWAFAAYQASLSFLYIRAVHALLGKHVRVTIDNTLSKGLYSTIRTGGVDKTVTSLIEEKMRRMVEEDLPIVGRTLPREELLEFLEENHLTERLDMVHNLPDLTGAKVYTLEDEVAIFYTELVCSTGYLRQFEVRRYKNGILLRFPTENEPGQLPEYVEQKKVYEVFAEETRWDRLLGVTFAADINKRILENDYKDLILLSEALHAKKLAEIAEEIHRTHKRIILVAGPSSSGKTTFAKRLCIQLRVTGERPLYLGTDDYFKERSETPLGPDGEKDFESLNAVDVDLFTQQINDLLAGRKVDIPEFDFILGTKVFGKRITSIDSTQPIVIEGIHALNPQLTAQMNDDEKYRIYISPMTQLNIDGYNRISTTDARMLRRMVRDSRTRGHNAAATISAWPKVRAGEDVNIIPYNGEADVFFNSQCIYELAVLKKYARPLLMEITPEEEEYPEAQRMLSFLEFFVELPDDDLIPNNSIMREFIGGSVFV